MIVRLLLSAFIFLLAGCTAGPKHVTVSEFKATYAEVGTLQSMRHVAFEGIRDNKAFLKVWRMRVIGPDENREIYVKLDELELPFRDTVRTTTISPIKLSVP